MTEPTNSDRLSDRDLADFRNVLDELSSELDRLATAKRDGAEIPSGGISFGKRVGEGTSIAIERFADVTIHGQLLQQLAAVERARERLDDGTFGTCTQCGRDIVLERLEVIPWAATCVGCT